MVHLAFRIIPLLLLLVLTATLSAHSQTLKLDVPVVERSNGARIQTPLFKPIDLVRLNWDRDASEIHLKVGIRPGDYSFKNVRLLGARSATFTPGVVGLPVGVYYAVLTNAAASTFVGIQVEASSDSAVDYTSEFKFAVESPNAPRITAPVGTISTPTPSFSWESIPGVPAYALIVSSTPFSIGSNPATGDATVEGINLVWALLTTNTTAVYGETGAANPLIQFAASPLVPGRTYNYSVLNAYSKTDGAFLSTVFGSVVSFTLQDRGTLTKPVLVEPDAGKRFSGPEVIRFGWEPISGALSYSLSIFERVRDGGSQADVPVFQLTTSNATVDVPASTIMRQGEYTWYVVANDTEGAASVSETSGFFYDVDMGIFSFNTRSADDDSELLGVAVTVRSTDGGYNPPNPFINRTSVSFSDSLVTGSYSFLAEKEGFADSTFAVTIKKNEPTTIDVRLRSLPSRISGNVIDDMGAPVADADVSFRALLDGILAETATGFDGAFSVRISPGSYEITVSKDGFKSSDPVIVTVGRDEHIVLPVALVIEAADISIAGRIMDPDGVPVSLATVLAAGPSLTQTTISDGEGAYSFDLSEGVWDIRAEKSGFITSDTRRLTLSRGDNLQDIDLVLIQQASRISGVVEDEDIQEDGTVTVRAMEGATVSAQPIAGLVRSVLTDNVGRFSLDLGSGSYSISATAPGHSSGTVLELQLDVGRTIDDIRFQLRELSALISGRIQSTDGTPIEGAVVRSSTGAETRSKQAGLYSLETDTGEQFLTVTKSGFASGSSPAVAPGPQSRLTGLDLKLSPNAGIIKGRVTADGLPLGKATVVAQSGFIRVIAVTDDDGLYSVSVPAGSWTLRVDAFRVVAVNAPRIILQPGQRVTGIDIILETITTNLTGYITDGQAGLRGVTVTATRTDNPAEEYSTVSLSDGTFSLVLSALAAYDIEASMKRFQPAVAGLTTGVKGSSSFISLELLPFPAILLGRIMDSSRRPVRGGTVAAFQNSSLFSSAESGIDGSYSLGLQPGSYQIRANALGFGSVTTTVDLAPGEEQQNADFLLNRVSATLIGMVTSATDQAPLSGSLLTLRSDAGVTTTQSLADGNFVFTGVPVGDYSLEIRKDGFETVTAAVLQIEAGQVRSLEITLSELIGVISGTVRDESGVSIPGASIRTLNIGRGQFNGISDSNGDFSMRNLPFADYTLRVEKDGFEQSNEQTTTLESGQSEVVIPSFIMRTASSSISGRVTDTVSLESVQNALVTVQSDAGTASGLTDSDGRYSLSGLASGTYSVTARRSGYSVTDRTVFLAAAGNQVLDIPIFRNEGEILGQVMDDKGQILPFRVPLSVSGASESVASRTEENGTFRIAALQNGATYLIQTRIQRAGYLETEATVTLTNNSIQISLVVDISTARIQGSAGTDGVTLVGAFAGTGQIAGVTASLSDGSYSIELLPKGRYVVTPQKEGFSFSPSSRTVEVSSGGLGSASFSATPSIGSVSISTRLSSGAGVGGVSVVASSEDRSIVRTLLTASDGTAFIGDLPLGHRYRLVPGGINATFEPAFAELDFSLQSSADLSFRVIPATATIEGRVLLGDGSLVDGASVTATHSATGRSSTVTTLNGTFRLSELTGGDYRISAARDGLREASVDIVLTDQEQKRGIEIILQPLSVSLVGKVLQNGKGKSGTEVSLEGTVTRTTLTDEEGNYRFDNVEVSETGESVLQLAVTREARAPMVRLIQVQSEMIGLTVSVPDFIVPTGRIRLQILSGTLPEPDLGISITGLFGEVFRGSSDPEGYVLTVADLDPGSYTYHLLDGELLFPPEDERRITVGDSDVNLVVELPFSWTPATSIRSDVVTTVIVLSSGGVNPDLFDGYLHYRPASGGMYTRVKLLRSGTSFTGDIPPQGDVGIVEFFVEMVEKTGSISFFSHVQSLVPVVVGRLATIRMTPELVGRGIRVGDKYTLDLTIRDGVGESLQSKFQGNSPEGTIEWISGEGLTLTQTDPEDQTRYTLEATRTGTFDLTLRVRLQNVDIVNTVALLAVNKNPVRLRISASGRRFSNEAMAVRFGVVAELEDGTEILLGDRLKWTVQPPLAGDITDDGTFSPSRSDFIGPVSVTATDEKTGEKTSLPFELFARLTGLRERTLFDQSGVSLTLPVGALPFVAELSLSHPRMAFPKKFSIPLGEETEYTAGDQLTRFVVRSDRSLPGDSLLHNGILSLPTDESLRLRDGSVVIGRFDPSELSWRLLPTEESGEKSVSRSVRILGEFGLLSQNRPLQLSHAAVLPSPFSPDVAPLKIGYLLESQDPPVRVSISIFNVRGDLVKTLLRGDLQYPGRYGSRSGLKEIVWDGTTDSGKMARNGRYIIRIQASDQSSTVTELLTAVLVR